MRTRHFSNFILLFLIAVCVGLVCRYVPLSACTHDSHKRASVLLELELQEAVSL